jgi:CHAT domain-containing protein
MTGQKSRCPAPEVLAAFVAGTLKGAELEMTADHLRECDECTEIVGDAAWVTRERVVLAVPETASSPMRWPLWLSLAAAALAAVAYLALHPHGATPTPTNAISLLVQATPRNGRFVEPRLTGGFPWAPLQPSHRGAPEPLDSGQMKLVGAAGVVLDRTAQDHSAAAQHAAALAHLLAGRPEEASDLLSAVAPSSSDAGIWSDLAATRYAAAVKADNPRLLAEALAAADMALRLHPKLAEALFNRALIVERLGLRDQARAAWDRYLAVDSRSEWAAEARQHVQDLAPLADFREEFTRQYDRLTRDPESAKKLARQFPYEARLWGETEVLARWAEALKDGDADAERHLRVADAFADVLAVDHGEHLLQAAVSAIRQAPVELRPVLAEAHLTFRAAQRTYKAKKPVEAEKLFTQAAEAFERAASPVALLAKYFAANTIYDQGRVEESQARLTALVATAPPQFPAHRAQVEWELGMTQASRGQWGEAMHALADSVSIFERLGETAPASAVRDMLAEAYDRVGDRRAAWDHRIIALRGLGRSDMSRLQVSLDAAARAAAIDREWPVSASFLGLELELGNGDEIQYVETLLLRARIEARMAQFAVAKADVRRAGVAIEHLHDQALRERAEADRLAMEGFVTAAPSDAVPLLGRAIEFHATRGRRMLLPEMFLYRGRALAAMGKIDSAAADFEAGIREFETQQQSIEQANERWRMYNFDDELFDEAVSLAAGRGDAVTAFAYSERARVHELLAATGVPVSSPAAATDNVVIEYVSLPARLVIFVAERGHVRAIQSEVARTTLTADAERLTRSAIAHDAMEFRRTASTLYDRLVAPVACEIPAGRLLVFVPDATLSGIPFAALLDGEGHYIVERHPVVVAPSAGVFSGLSTRPSGSSHGSLHLLLIAGPSFSDGSVLRSEQREVDLVSAAYGSEVEVAPKGSDSAAFEVQASKADVIHFIGHAIIPDQSADAALVTWAGDNTAGRLGVREIAAMHLQKTRAVVLAACATARTRTGKRSISIAHAFLAAGVPSVVATLWPIEDESAADFFPRFHRHLAQGLSPAEALRATQIAWIHRRNSSPGMWAAVQLIGS